MLLKMCETPDVICQASCVGYGSCGAASHSVSIGPEHGPVCSVGLSDRVVNGHLLGIVAE